MRNFKLKKIDLIFWNNTLIYGERIINDTLNKEEEEEKKKQRERVWNLDLNRLIGFKGNCFIIWVYVEWFGFKGG